MGENSIISCFNIHIIITFTANGFMEINLDDDMLATIFGKKAKRTRMKIYNHPLNSCYQRTSDSPQFDDDDDDNQIHTRRRRRDVSYHLPQSKFFEQNANKNELKQGQYTVGSRIRRQITYDPFCDNVFNGASSTLAS